MQMVDELDDGRARDEERNRGEQRQADVRRDADRHEEALAFEHDADRLERLLDHYHSVRTPDHDRQRSQSSN